MNYILFVFLLLPLYCNAQLLELSPSVESYAVTPKVEIYKDNSGKLHFQQVQRQKFISSGKTGLLFPFSNSATWLKVILTNHNPNQKNWVLEWDNAMAEEVDFYISERNGTYRVRKTGMTTLKKPSLLVGNKPTLTFDLDYLGSKTIYMKVKGQRAHYASVNLFSASAYRNHEVNQLNIVAFLSGAIAIRLVYVFLMAIFAVKDSDFRRYAVLLGARSFAFWGLYGILGYFFSNPTISLTVSFLSFHFLPLALIVALSVIFPGSHFHSWINRILQFIVVSTIFLAVGILFSYRWELLLASTYLMLATQLFILAMYLLAIVKKYPINWNYSPAYLTGLLGYLFIQMRLVGWVDFIWVLPTAFIFFILEFLVFGYSLGRIVRDYERKRSLAFQELAFTKEQTRQVREIDRLKTRFFTNISHEFRTPLSLLIAPLEEIRQKYPQERLIPLMQRNVKRLQLLIGQILDLSKLEAGAFKPEPKHGDIACFLSSIVSSFESLAQSRHVHFSLQQSHPNYETDFDADKLEKIVTNLLSNAFKFTPAYGYIQVVISYSMTSLVMEVKDTGKGIDPQRLSRIFDRFYQADDTAEQNFEGTGIGLALVKELVDLLKGKIMVKSEVGKGTSFTVTLPLNQQYSTALPGYQGKSVEQPDDLSVTFLSGDPLSDLNQPEELPILLIVEDNVDLRMYLHALFKPYYHVMEATDGQYGLDRAFETIPDIVVSDLMMPRIDGFALCRLLKSDQRTSHIPVVLLTAKATLADRLEGFELGADDYLEKPFHKEELLQRVNNLIRQRALLRQKFSLLATNPKLTQPEQLDNQFIRKAQEVVEQNLGNSRFTADDFSELMQMSRSNLHRKLKALTDQTTSEFVRNIRLNRASQLLKQNDSTVSEVAYLVGFESLPYFSKTFQEYHGVSPSAMNRAKVI